jgi:hypothetical protein
MFNSYYELMELPHEEADLLVGKTCVINKRDCLIIQLDEYFTEMSAFSTKYSVIEVYRWESSHKLYPTFLSVRIPGIDDANFTARFEHFTARFKSSETIHLSGLIEATYNWAARSNFRHINCHALKDYCMWLGACEFDWN